MLQTAVQGQHQCIIKSTYMGRKKCFRIRFRDLVLPIIFDVRKSPDSLLSNTLFILLFVVGHLEVCRQGQYSV